MLDIFMTLISLDLFIFQQTLRFPIPERIFSTKSTINTILLISKYLILCIFYIWLIILILLVSILVRFPCSYTIFLFSRLDHVYYSYTQEDVTRIWTMLGNPLALSRKKYFHENRAEIINTDRWVVVTLTKF